MDDDSSDVQSVYIYNGVGEVPMNVTHVRIDRSVTIIPNSAFQFRVHLEQVELPEGLIRIGDKAFYECPNLKRINIPSTVVEIGEQAFDKCSFNYYEELVINLPMGLQRLGQYAFQYCKSLQRIHIPPGVQAIKNGTFWDCSDLTALSLSEGLQDIGKNAFYNCDSLVSVKLPCTLKVIQSEAFQSCDVLNEIHMPDTIERINLRAFNGCNFQNFRIPPLLTNVDIGIVGSNKSLVSLEISENLEVCSTSNGGRGTRLASLRNIAFPPDCEMFKGTFDELADLLVALPDADVDTISDALQHRHRFDDLPIHKICYYQSYHDSETTLQSLKREINPWTSKPPGKLNTTGKEQDCLGMTPLHILACSTKPTIDMYQLLIDKYPETLIMKDKWGDIPLLYAFWCNAPTEVLDLLVESYKSVYPNYKFDWKGMLLTMAKRHVPLANIHMLVNTQTSSFPDQGCNMQDIVMELAASDTAARVERRRQRRNDPRSTSVETFRYLLQLSITKRLDSLGISRWRIELENNISTFPEDKDVIGSSKKTKNREEDTKALYNRLAIYESIKESTSVLELALWKAKIDEGRNKRAKVDSEVSYRDQCRINCGADLVIRSVLPYLIPKALAERALPSRPERTMMF